MSNRRKQAPKMPDNWQLIIGQLKNLLAESSMGVLVVVIDQSTSAITIHQHGKQNTNIANVN